jgi:hypothetical protein
VSFCVVVRSCSGSAVGINPSSDWKRDRQLSRLGVE